MPTTSPGRTLIATAALAAVLLGAWATTTAQNGETSPFSQRDLIGVVTASQSVPLSPQLPGKLVEIRVKMGASVKHGDVIALLDDGLQQVVVENAEVSAESVAMIESAQAMLDEAQGELEREQELFDQNVSKEWQVRKRRVAVKRAQAELTGANERKKEAQIKLKLEKAKLAKYAIRAPYDGRISMVLGEIGGSVSEQDPVVTIVAIDPLKVKFDAPKELWGKLKIGERYAFRASEPINDKLMARLETVAPEIDFASGTFRAEFTIDNPDGALPPGFEVTLVWPQQASAARE